MLAGMYFLNASTIVTFFVACVLGFEVAPHLGLVSRAAARAVRLSAVFFALTATWGFFLRPLEGLLHRTPDPELALRLLPLVLSTAAWLSLAGAVVAFMASAPAKPRGDGPEVRS